MKILFKRTGVGGLETEKIKQNTLNENQMAIYSIL